MTPEEELKALELIDSIPILDELIPVQTICIGRDERVAIPEVLKDYLTKLDQLPELDADGKIHYKEYLELLERNDINQSPLIITRVVTKENYKNLKE
jgi:hypothetical protein